MDLLFSTFSQIMSDVDIEISLNFFLTFSDDDACDTRVELAFVLPFAISCAKKRYLFSIESWPFSRLIYFRFEHRDRVNRPQNKSNSICAYAYRGFLGPRD